MIGETVVSPYVRRLRLGTEVRTLREAANLTHDDLARILKKSRPRISDLELGKKKPDLVDIMKILEVVGVKQGTAKWHNLITIARDASEAGWWENVGAAMGVRQLLYADLEAGARTHREYSMFIPGLLQVEEFVRARASVALRDGSPPYDLDRAVAARAMRQSMQRRPGGSSYSVVLDVVAISRLAVPAPVMARQLDAIAHVRDSEGGDRISVRVLPVDATVADFWLPRSQFGVYTYPDPDDGTWVCVDTETEDRVLRAEAAVPYVQLLDRLEDAALSVEDSAALISEMAAQFTKE